MKTGKFVCNKTYYSDTVHEWNLPAGITCPFAKVCRVSVDRVTGKFSISKGYFTCYAAKSERFPAVREHRWTNYEFILGGGVPELPKGCKNVRVHASGDFFSQAYFDMWISVAKAHPEVHFWAFTKSIQYWLNRKNDIPSNFVLTESYGGHLDHLIEQNGLKSARVYGSQRIVPAGMPIDTNDDYARIPGVCFALLDNNKVKKKA